MQLIGTLVVICLNLSIALFVLGLIAGKRGAGLRRMAFGAFALALLPSVLVGLARESGAGISTPGNPFAVIGGFVVLSAIAYAVLAIRKLARREPPARIQMKRPFTHRPDNDLISMLRDRMERDE